MERLADTQYPVLDVIKKRWSPYVFADRPVEKQKLRCLLEAARWAASSFNEQPWRFILATKGDQAAFEKLLGCLVEANQAWAKHVPVLMIGISKDNFTKNDKPNRVSQHDLALAMGNLTLQAASMDLYVHQMAGIDQDKVRETFAVPDGFTPQTGIAIGYHGTNDAVPDDIRKRDQGKRERMPFDQFVFGEKFGTPSGLF